MSKNTLLLSLIMFCNVIIGVVVITVTITIFTNETVGTKSGQPGRTGNKVPEG